MARSTFILIEDSAATSGAAAGVSPAAARVAGLDLEQAHVMHMYWKPVETQERIPGFLVHEQLTGVNVFFHNTIVTTPTCVSVVSATARSVEYAFHRPGTVVTSSFRLRNLEFPPITFAWNTWTVPGWELVPALPPEIASGVASIEAVINDIRRSMPIVRSTSLMRLAERAAAKQSAAPEDLDTWARRIADDVKDAND